MTPASASNSGSQYSLQRMHGAMRSLNKADRRSGNPALSADAAGQLLQASYARAVDMLRLCKACAIRSSSCTDSFHREPWEGGLAQALRQ